MSDNFGILDVCAILALIIAILDFLYSMENDKRLRWMEKKMNGDLPTSNKMPISRWEWLLAIPKAIVVFLEGLIKFMRSMIKK